VKQAAGQSFGSLVRAEATAIYDKVVYLDRLHGLDGNSGDSWESPVLTINGACDKFYGGDYDAALGRHYAIVYRGSTTTARAFTSLQVIDVPGVHLIGAGAWYGHGGGSNSCFVAGSSSGYAYPAALVVEENGCSIEGMKFYMPSEYAKATPYEFFVGSGDTVDLAVVNNQFIGANADGVMTSKYVAGVGAQGGEGGYYAGNEFMYCYWGIMGSAGSSRYFHKNKIEYNRMFGCAKGIYFPDAYGIENSIEGNIILRPSPSGTAYGYTMTGGIDFGGNPSGNFCTHNFVGHATKTTAFVKGSGTNYWDLNYYDAGSGGTLYDGG
jgi:hypothetical protein